jgi:hypothetical protein
LPNETKILLKAYLVVATKDFLEQFWEHNQCCIAIEIVIEISIDSAKVGQLEKRPRLRSSARESMG